MSRPSLRVHTDAVIAALQGAGLVVGDAQAPKGVPHKYVVVYPIPGRSSGPLSDPNEDAELVYQVTCVGETRQQAQWLADQAMVLLDGLTVDDRYVPHVALDSHDGVQRDDQQTPALFLSAPRFRVFTTPE